MKAFELPAGTRLKLTKTTPRKEIHGEDHVQAISLRLRWETTNDSLAKLHPNLKAMLFFRSEPEEAQSQIDGVPEIIPNLRCPVVALPLKVEGEFSGYQLTIEHGIDDSTVLQLYLCEMSKYQVDAKEGGTAIIEWSLASNKEVTPELVGALCALEGEEITCELVAPEAPAQVIDGTQAAFDADHPGAAGPLFDDDAQAQDATDAFVRSSGDEGHDLDDVSDAEGLDMHGEADEHPTGLAVAALHSPKNRVPVAYRDPMTGSTWSGRGLQPKWLKKALASGRTLGDFRVADVSPGVEASRRRMAASMAQPGDVE